MRTTVVTTQVDDLASRMVRSSQELEDCGILLGRAEAELRGAESWRMAGWPELEARLAAASRLAMGLTDEMAAAGRALRRYAEDLARAEQALQLPAGVLMVSGAAAQTPTGLPDKSSPSPKPSQPAGVPTPQPEGWNVSGHTLPSGGAMPYRPPKGSHGKPQKVRGNPSFEDAQGRRWTWDKTNHRTGHWDVVKKGTHWNVDEWGRILNRGRALTSGEIKGVQDGSAAAGAGIATKSLWSQMTRELSTPSDWLVDG